MKLVNVKNLSLTLVVGSTFLFAACGKKNNDKKADADTPKISQPYQKDAKILSDAQGGTDGVKVSCSGTHKITFTNGKYSPYTFTFDGDYKSGNFVEFSSITTQDLETKENKQMPLNADTIETLCTLYNLVMSVEDEEDPSLKAKDWTFELTSCKDESGKTYKISNATPVSGVDLWCAGK